MSSGPAAIGASMAMPHASGAGTATAPADAAVAAGPAPAHSGAAAPTADAATPARPDAPVTETPPDFAALLATGESGEAAGATAALAKTTPAEPVAPECTAAAQTPDQLLALLAGSQAISAVPQPPQAGLPGDALVAARGEAPREPRLVAAAMSLAASTLAAGGTPTASGAATAIAADPTPVLAGLAATPTDTAAANAAPSEALSFDTLLAQAPAPALATANSTGSTVTTASLAAPLALPADPDTGFDDGFGGRIAWMAEQRIGHAELRLNPDNLGPIDVRVQVDGTRVNTEFHSAHAEVRQALEASVPRLRELLGQHGLQLGQADVGQRQAGQQAHPGGRAGEASGKSEAPATVAMPRLRSRGLVDEYV